MRKSLTLYPIELGGRYREILIWYYSQTEAALDDFIPLPLQGHSLPSAPQASLKQLYVN